MLADALETHRVIVIAQPDEGAEARLKPVAGAGLIVSHEAMPDGRSNIVLRGQARVSIEEIESDRPYRLVRATILTDLGEPVRKPDEQALAQLVARFISAIRKRNSDLHLPVPLDAPAELLSDLACQHLVFDEAVRQDLLETLSTRQRVRKLLGTLGAQFGLLENAIPEYLN
jgi:uncharacterized protein